MLKNILNLQGVVVLTKAQQKNLNGGRYPACPQSTCSSDSQCPGSYCANTGCKNSDGTDSSFWSCQWKA
jgi:hypothetical protein